MRKPERDAFVKKVFIVVSIVAGFALVAAVLYLAADVFLLLFAGLMLSAVLRGVGTWIHQRTRLSRRAGVLMFVVLVTLATVASFRVVMPTISVQIAELTTSLPQSIRKATDALLSVPSLRAVSEFLGVHSVLPRTDMLIGQTAPVVTHMLGGVLDVVLVIFIGIYHALNPDVYANGFMRLVPMDRRRRVRDYFIETERKLYGWLAGQFVAMTFIGVLTTIGLLILKVPLAIILGIIAGLLSFIPTFGLILSLIPAVSLAFAHNPQLALYVVVLYLAVHFIESYFLTPWVQFHNISLPPILVVLPQIIIGLLFGFLGLALATPLTLVGLMAVKFFYVEDFLGDHRPHHR